MKSTLYPTSLSFWEIKQYLQNLDLTIIGSGIVGLTTAIFYQRRNPNHRILILEKGILPAGASTKNAGFACFGSASEILADLRNESEEHVFETVTKRVNGLKELQSLIGKQALGLQMCGGYELFTELDESVFNQCMNAIPYLNRMVEEVTGLKNTYGLNDERIGQFGFQGIGHLISNKHEGAIDTGAMMDALIRLTQELGVKILNSIEVEQVWDSGNSVEIELANGWSITSKKAHVATNGFAKKLLPQLDVNPARAQVLVTRPIANLKIDGTFHMNEGFYYFRNVGNRVLFGGGRQLAFEEETTTELDLTEKIQKELETKLADMLLPNQEFEIDHRWAGIMGVGANSKQAIITPISQNLTCSVRMGGMGVAIGTSIGKEAACLIDQ